MADEFSDFVSQFNKSAHGVQDANPAAPPQSHGSNADAFATNIANQAWQSAQKNGNYFSADSWVGAYNEGLKQSLSLQKSVEEKDIERQKPTEKDQEGFENANKGWSTIGQLDASWDDAKKNTNGFGAGNVQSWAGGVQRMIGGAFGQVSPSYDAWQQITHMSRPVINQAILHEGKAQAGEKSNIQGFEANLPEESDTPAQKDAKLNSLRLQLYNATQSQMDSLAQSGRTGAMEGFMNSDTWKQMRTWHDNYVGTLQQKVQPTGPGDSYAPTPTVDAKLNAAIGAQKAAQQANSGANTTNPINSVTANQAPAQTTPSPQSASPMGNAGVSGQVDNIWAKIFGQ